MQDLCYYPVGRGLQKIKEEAILSDITFSILKQQALCIIGPNGSGKTTLLRIILGLIHPSSGTLKRVDNLKIGYVPQKLTYNTQFPITVERLLALFDPPPSNSEIDLALDRVQGLGLKYKLFSHLSGGERQRVLLARALLRSPDLLVLDEPTQGLDISGQKLFYEILAKEKKERSILYVSHDLHMVMAHTDQVICLNHHICCMGSPHSVLQDKSYQAIFGLSFYDHRHDHHH